VGISEGDYISMLKYLLGVILKTPYKGNVKSDKSPRAISEIPQVVALIINVVLDDHMTLADPCVQGGYHEVVEHLAVGILLLRSYDGAPVTLVALGAN
jgi:hypothetical protein